MAHVILVSYAGYIKTPSCLGLDNGLANLAGALIAHGHDVLIEDYNTLSIMRRMTPPHLAREVASLMSGDHSDGSLHDTLDRVKHVQGLMDHYQESVIEEIFEELAEKIERHKSAAVGFKCWASDGAIVVQKWSQLIRKRFPKVKILLGGPCCEIEPEWMARLVPEFDIMATHEAEHSIVGMMDHIERGTPLERVPGILFRKGNSVQRTPPELIHDLDELPAAVYRKDVYPTAGTAEKLNLVVLDESRGCPNSCHFCVHPEYAGSWRKKSVGRVVRDIRAAQSELGTRYFRMAGSNTPPRLLNDLAHEILRQQIDIRFACFSHVNGMREEYLPTLHRAGLRSIFYGIESADDEVLHRAANKRVNVERAKRIIKATCAAGIFATGSFIYPMPFETPQSRARTIDFVREVFANNPYGSAQLLTPCPIPQTQWWANREHFGFELDESEFLTTSLTLRVRHMYPPEHQDLLPYKLAGKDHAALLGELTSLMTELEPEGVVFNISDDVAIIAYGAGSHPAEFKATMGPAFLRGELDQVEKMVQSFNRHRARAAA